MKILVVDDEPDVVESIRLGFALQWREVDVLGAATGDVALDIVEREAPDLVLLDIGLPGQDGFEVLRELRAFSDVPVVMLTARDDAMDKVKGLELGADDYVTKPFNHLELMARVRAVLRRHDMPAPASRAPSFRSGDLEVDFARQEARLRGEHVDLTPTEYKLLYHLVRNAGSRAPARDAAREGLGPRLRRRDRLRSGLHPPAARQAGRRPGQPALHPDGAPAGVSVPAAGHVDRRRRGLTPAAISRRSASRRPAGRA